MNASAKLGEHIAFPDLSLRKRWLLAVPALLYAAVVAPFVYRDVVGEPDLERVVLAVLYGASSGLHERANYHYDYLVSFGYYAGLYEFLPRSVLLSSSALIAAVNDIGYGFAILAVLMLGLYIEKLFGMLAAVAASLLFALSPVFLDLGTSGHPQIPGLALAFLGAYLLTWATDARVRLPLRAAATLAALAVTTAAVCVRNDVALVFPFVTLAGNEREVRSLGRWLRACALRLAVLGLAVIGYAVLESHAYHDMGTDTEFLKSFFATFYRLDTVPRGFEVLVLCTGIATVLTFAATVFFPAARRLRFVHVGAIGLLALPTLIFWLPNSTPSRHLLPASLAIALYISLVLASSMRARTVIAIALLVPVANQLIAEALHDRLIRAYQWQYPQLTPRRATTSVALGAFPLDHDAKQQGFVLLREEGRAFARACSGHLVAFAEQPHYMMLSLLELDRTVRFSSRVDPDGVVTEAVGKRCVVAFVSKDATGHDDVVRDYLSAARYAGWPMYFQEAKRDRFDRTPVPPERRYCVDTALDRRLSGNDCLPVTASAPLRPSDTVRP